MIKLKNCPRCDGEMKFYLDFKTFNADGKKNLPQVSLLCYGTDCLISYGVGDFKIDLGVDLHEHIIDLIKQWNG